MKIIFFLCLFLSLSACKTVEMAKQEASEALAGAKSGVVNSAFVKGVTKCEYVCKTIVLDYEGSRACVGKTPFGLVDSYFYVIEKKGSDDLELDLDKHRVAAERGNCTVTPLQ